MIQKQLFLDVAWKNYGVPYAWGGDDPMKGFDCSGFAIECLKSVGALPHRGDWTAEMLRQMYRIKSPRRATMFPWEGDLVFYVKNGKAIHVEICIRQGYTLGASGGGSRTQTEQDAIDQNAFIKVRPFDYRGEEKEFYPFDLIID